MNKIFETGINYIKENIPFIVIMFLALFLFIKNLGNQYLWQDEAQTALISKTILKHGVPIGTDGKNFFSQEFGAEYGPNYIWKWHTWLQFYLVAASFVFLPEFNFFIYNITVGFFQISHADCSCFFNTGGRDDCGSLESK